MLQPNMLLHFCFSNLGLKCFLRGFCLYYRVPHYFLPSPSLKKKTFFVSCLSPFPLWQWFDLLVLLSKTDPVWRNDWNLFPSLLPHLSSFFPSCVWPWFDFLFPAPRHSWQHDFVCSQMPRLPAGKSTLPSAIPLWLLACLWKQQEY